MDRSQQQQMQTRQQRAIEDPRVVRLFKGIHRIPSAGPAYEAVHLVCHFTPHVAWPLAPGRHQPSRCAWDPPGLALQVPDPQKPCSRGQTGSVGYSIGLSCGIFFLP